MITGTLLAILLTFLQYTLTKHSFFSVLYTLDFMYFFDFEQRFIQWLSKFMGTALSLIMHNFQTLTSKTGLKTYLFRSAYSAIS